MGEELSGGLLRRGDRCGEGTTVGPGHCGAGSPLPWVLASMISLMRPAPTLFLAASFTLYQVPHLRLSSLKERSEELMNTSFHSSLLSTEYWSTKPVGARMGRSPLGAQAAGAGEWHPGRVREGVTAGTQSQRGTLRPPRGHPVAMSAAVPGQPLHTDSCPMVTETQPSTPALLTWVMVTSKPPAGTSCCPAGPCVQPKQRPARLPALPAVQTQAGATGERHVGTPNS